LFLCACPMIAHAQSVINRSMSATDITGVLEPVNNTEVATAEMGIVREIYVKLGDKIESGTPIGRLDQEHQNVQVHEAELEAAAQGLLDTARSEWEFAARRVVETREMVRRGATHPKELERYEMELNIAEAKYLAQKEAKEVSHARLEKARLMLSERTIRAPHSGTVVEVYREVGEYIAGNAPALVRLLDASRLRARFFLTDEASAKFRQLKYADVRLSNHVVVKAEIEFISPFAIAEGQVIEMTVLIDNFDGAIRSSKCDLVAP
jgi:RND family efflux transporter MFP subunit